MKSLNVNKYMYEIKNKSISFIWTHKFKDNNVQFAFYLKKNFEIIKKVGYSSSKAFIFELKDAGEYNIIAFIKIKNKILFYECNTLLYFPTNINILGPKVLCKYAEDNNCYVDYGSDAILIDCIDIALEWEEKIFSNTVPSKNEVYKLKSYFEDLLNKYTKTYMFLLRWHLWPKYEKCYNLHWILEELYDCCRKHEVFIKELNVGFSDNELNNCSVENLYEVNRIDICKKIIDVTKELEYKDIDTFNVKSYIQDNKLIAEINYNEPQTEDRICYYLLRDGLIVDKTLWMNNKKYVCMLNESGVYVVQAFLKRGTYKVIKYAEPIFFATQKLKEEYDKFINDFSKENDSQLLYQNIPLKIMPKPYADICVVSSKKIINKEYCPFIPKVEELIVNDLYIKIYSSVTPKETENNKKVILSGYYYNKEIFYYGTEDIPKIINFDELSGKKGHYSAIVWDSKTIKFTNDLFAFKRWFYFNDDNYYIISNNYHLLLITLKNMNINLKLDIEKAIITLSSVDIQILLQNFTRKMDMIGVYQIPADKSIELNLNGWTMADNKLGKILRCNKTYHEDTYRKMLCEAKQELINYSKAIFKESRFSNIVVDLSGGLDSRMMYGIITNIPESKNRVYINSKDTPGSNDLLIATQLNSIYKYPYNILSEDIKYIELKEADALNRSYYMGTYFSKSLINNLAINKNVQQLLGACGEIIARPYISRKYMGTNVERAKDMKKFVSLIYEDYAYLIKVCGRMTSGNFKKYLKEELMQQPGTSNLECLDRQYLSYRHGYHFDTILTILGRNHQMPLQSQKMLEIHHMAFNVHRSIRLQLDMIYLINPILLMIPFDSKFDNFDFDKIKDKLINYDSRFYNVNLPVEEEKELWKKAEILRIKNKKILVKSEVTAAQQSEIIYSALLYNFKKLMLSEPNINNYIGLSLYHCIKSLKPNDKKIVYWYNKITSLLDQCVIFKRKKRISIFGSCVSRDILEYDKLEQLELKTYVARQSVFSAISTPININEATINLSSQFQKRMLLTDLRKTTFTELENDGSEYLLIDLIDERFAIAEYEKSLCTVSSVFSRGVADVLENIKIKPKIIKNGKLFLDNIAADNMIKDFCKRVSKIYAHDHIILHKALMVDTYIASDGNIRKFSDNHLKNNKKINAILNYIYLCIEQNLPGIHIIDEMYDTHACENNKWGLAPMHYEEKYYYIVLNKLLKILK